jgi:hypothetical protein
VTYSTDKNIAANLQTITAAKAREVIEMNRRGEKPLSLEEKEGDEPVEKPHSVDLDGGDISRFDKAKKKKKKKKPQRPKGEQPNGRQPNGGQPNGGQPRGEQHRGEQHRNEKPAQE